MRDFIGALLIKIGVALLKEETRKTIRNILLYHVPGALTQEEKMDTEYTASVYRKRVML